MVPLLFVTIACGAISGFRTVAQWEKVYSAFGQGGVTAFVQGGSGIIHEGLGIPSNLTATFLATIAVLFVQLKSFYTQAQSDPSASGIGS